MCKLKDLEGVESRGPDLEGLAVNVLLGDKVALHETFGKQQQIDLRGSSPFSEALHHLHRSVHIAEDLRCLANPDPHHPMLWGTA